MNPLLVVLFSRELTPQELSDIPPFVELVSGLEPCAAHASRGEADRNRGRPRPADHRKPKKVVGGRCRPWLHPGALSADLVSVTQDPEAEDRAELEEVLGFWPRHAIQLSVGSHDADSQKAAGRSALALADRYQGLIDLCGCVVPPPKSGPGPGRRADWEGYCLHDIAAFVSQLPGTVKEWYYGEGSGLVWVHHFVDADFMRAWLLHPNFHLVQ